MADKVLYSEIMTRMHGDINYIAEEAYRDGYDHCEKEMKKKVEEAYKKGFEDGKAQIELGCEGCRYVNDSEFEEPCITCSNSYKNKWTAKQTDNEIKVGDEVEWKDEDFNDGKGVVLWIDGLVINGRRKCYVMYNDGSVGAWSIDEFIKTGRHFNISSILEAMRE